MSERTPHRCSLPEFEAPELPSAGEAGSWATADNLDAFFTRVYRYYEGKGFASILIARVLNIAALGFTVAFSGVLLLWVDWGALHAQCVHDDTCDIASVVFYRHPYGAWRCRLACSAVASRTSAIE